MGICVSLSSNNEGDRGCESSAHVISLNGDLVQIPVPVTVSEVLEQQQQSEPCFLCNSERLNFDELISSLKAEYQLQAGEIYFMMPENKLNFKLSASDMASLAVKASRAVQTTEAASSAASWSSCSPRRKNRKTRISPIILGLQNQEQEYSENEYILQKRIGGNSSFNNQKNSGLGVSRAGSVRKMQRPSSRKAKLAARSFRLKLSTIYEGSVSP